VTAPPKGLKRAGLKLWEDTHAAVAEGWQLDAVDLELLEQACTLKDAAARLQRRVDREGATLKSEDGQVIVHPLLREVRLTRQQIVATVRKVQIAPPRQLTGHLNKRQRDQLADARRARWPRAS
jgi:P27 family predicted phage terminase small subunit